MNRDRKAKLAVLVVAPTAGACALTLSILSCYGSSGTEIPVSPAGDTAASMDPMRDAASGPPFLTELSVVVGSGSSAPALQPAFDPSAHDYFVGCAAGTNTLTVSMTASQGATALVTEPTLSPSASPSTRTFEVPEGQAIVIVVTSATGSGEYWVRCLPHDFPPIEWQVHSDVGTAPPGYYLLGAKTRSPYGAYAMALDSRGVPVWFLKDEASLPNDLNDVESVVPGTISFNPSVYGYPFEVHQLSSSATTYLGIVADGLDPHELRYLPNGDYLVFNHPVRTGVDLTGLALPIGDGGLRPLGPNSDIVDCVIQELTPKGKVAWQWAATDHFVPKLDTTFPQLADNGITSPNHQVVIDAFHCNSIDVDPMSGDLLVSSRHMDSVFYIEKSSGAVLWKMGGASYTTDNAIYVPVADPFFRQHDARLLPGWSSTCRGGTGQISMFDDETDGPSPMRAVVYDVSVGGSGTEGCGDTPPAKAGATMSWQYRSATTAVAMGSFRILADGSRVIGWGSSLEYKLALTEVDVAGHDLIDMLFLSGTDSYRAVKVPISAFDLEVLRRATGPER
jgi:Arylsulfotransferase (ASST)